MASNTIRARASLQNGVASVRTLISHPMETGQRRDSAGETIPAHYIEDMHIELNGEKIMVANMSAAISRNPYLAFQFEGASSGDTLSLSWNDNKGDSDATEITL